MREEGEGERGSGSGLAGLWEQLACVETLSFVAESALATGWHGEGRGDVGVTMPAEDALLFYESGTWRPDGGVDLSFRNVFRWTKLGDAIRLEHLRFGPDAPVYLFDLMQHEDGIWRSADPHRCKADRYTASLTMQDGAMDLVWRIDGPKKQERIAYRYSGSRIQ